MPGAGRLPIDHALRPMDGADRFAAGRALHHFVHADRLAGPALAVAQACGAQTTTSLRRLGVALLRVSVADDPAAAAARREARRAGGVAVLRADPRVRRAVLEAARWAHPHVLVARGLAVHATLADAVLGAEVLGTDGAAVRAGLAAAVPPLVAAHHERRRRSPALRARHDPVGRTAQRTLRAECGATPSSRLEPPLDALDQRGGLDELQGMYDRPPGLGTLPPGRRPPWRQPTGRTRRFRPPPPPRRPRRAAPRARPAAPPDARPAASRRASPCHPVRVSSARRPPDRGRLPAARSVPARAGRRERESLRSAGTGRGCRAPRSRRPGRARARRARTPPAALRGPGKTGARVGAG